MSPVGLFSLESEGTAKTSVSHLARFRDMIKAGYLSGVMSPRSYEIP